MTGLAFIKQLWHEHKYDDALAEVVRLFEITEFKAESQPAETVLAAAGAALWEGSAVTPWLADTPVGIDPAEEERLALLGCYCCNSLAESHLRRQDWRGAAQYCALAWRLEEGDAEWAGRWRADGHWAVARYGRLFHAAEAVRVAGKQERGRRPCVPRLSAESPGAEVPESRAHLAASRRCLEACEEVFRRWPSCTRSPESLYTCLAEVLWRLKDLGAVRCSCRRALSLLAPAGGLKPAKAYAAIFVLLGCS